MINKLLKILVAYLLISFTQRHFYLWSNDAAYTFIITLLSFHTEFDITDLLKKKSSSSQYPTKR